MSTRPIVAVSLKTYFGHAATLEWVRAAVEASRPFAGSVDVLLIPTATALVQTLELVSGTGILVGAQDCSWTAPGAFTGEVPAAFLREIGVAAVEIGHAERRRLFGDDDATVARKTAAAVEAGLVPLICVGEAEHISADAAAAACAAQLDSALARVPAPHPLIVAYEPLWAIGARHPAEPHHIRAVCEAIGVDLRRFAEARVVYGGTAGPGLLPSIHASVNGLFMGRRAHDVRALAMALEEVASLHGSVTQPGPKNRGAMMPDDKEPRPPLRIVVGADDAGVEYKDALAERLRADPRVSEVIDVGIHRGEHVPYPDVATDAARRIVEGEADRGLLICGTGLGMAIAANKTPGIRAVTAHDPYSVSRSVLSNNAQVLAMGQRVIGLELAQVLLDTWLGVSFDENSPSAAKVARIIEHEHRLTAAASAAPERS